MHCHSSCSWSYRLASVSSRNHLVRRWLNANSWQALILSLEVQSCILECYPQFLIILCSALRSRHCWTRTGVHFCTYPTFVCHPLGVYLEWLPPLDHVCFKWFAFSSRHKEFCGIISYVFAQGRLHNSLLGSNVTNWRCSGDCTASFSWRWLSLLYSLSYLRCRFPIDLRKVRAIGYS